MNLDQIPLLAMLKGKLGYLNQRQKVLAQNVANADTPSFVPSDLKPFEVARSQLAMARAGAPAGAVLSPAGSPAGSMGANAGGGGGDAGGFQATRTNSAHMAIEKTPRGQWKTSEVPDSDIRLDGNQVVLEDQMIKVGETRLDYDAAIGLYQKSLGLLRMAARRPGG